MWPLAALRDRLPVVTDGFSLGTTTHRRHLGIDMMYRRLSYEPALLPRSTPNYTVPANTPVLATADGQIWKADLSSRGHQIQIDHGAPYGLKGVNTYYQHLSSFHKPWAKGDYVQAGDVLGIVGGDITPGGYPLHHLHFELWFPIKNTSVASWAVDPVPFLTTWWITTI
jgi:murein DD-endopeptidase MepM/ murein hydrolase activator NlpD